MTGLCGVAAQFYEQGDEMRSVDGQAFAHYRGTQFGAQRLCSTDSKKVLAVHALFAVKEFALDKVKLVGVHPLDLKGKFVVLTMPQWAHMSKMVTTSKGDHSNRMLRAEQHDEKLKLPPPTTHPGFQIVSAMQIEDTTPRMKSMTNTAFDVRGMPVVPGDFVQFVRWPDTDNMMHLVVTAQDLTACQMSLGDPTQISATKTWSMSEAA